MPFVCRMRPATSVIRIVEGESAINAARSWFTRAAGRRTSSRTVVSVAVSSSKSSTNDPARTCTTRPSRPNGMLTVVGAAPAAARFSNAVPAGPSGSRTTFHDCDESGARASTTNHSRASEFTAYNIPERRNSAAADGSTSSNAVARASFCALGPLNPIWSVELSSAMPSPLAYRHAPHATALSHIGALQQPRVPRACYHNTSDDWSRRSNVWRHWRWEAA